jgi:hypothetical protein
MSGRVVGTYCLGFFAAAITSIPSADAKVHGTYAKAPRVARLMLSRLLNSTLNLSEDRLCHFNGE